MQNQSPLVKQTTLKTLIDRLPLGTDLVTKLTPWLDTVSKALANLQNTFEPDDMVADRVHAMRQSVAQQALDAVIIKARAEILQVIAAERSRVAAAQITKGRLVANSDQQEIRSIFRSLDMAVQTRFMANAINSGDGATAAAITEVSPVLSRLSADQAKGYRMAYLEKNAFADTKYIDDTLETCNFYLTVAAAG